MISALVGFAVLEGVGLATVGREATLSVYLRRLGGLEPRCRHRHLSRAVLLLFFGWATAHLGWGLLGWEPERGADAP
jgi:hypothetical protein